MYVKAGMVFQPRLNLRVRMCGVIIHDEMEGLVLGRLPLNQPQKGQPFCVAMARETGGDDVPFGHIESANKVVVPWRV